MIVINDNNINNNTNKAVYIKYIKSNKMQPF